MKSERIIWCLSIISLLSLVTIIAQTEQVSAQIGSIWAPDQRVPGYLDDTLSPYLLVDQNKTVHAFTSQWVGTSDRQDAVVYRQWTLVGGWTIPVDILLSPVGDAQVDGAFLDPAAIMHVIFLGGEARSSDIYYSRAPAASANRSLAWTAPELVGENASVPGFAAISGDGRGNLVIVYDGYADGNGVYSIQSSDSGLTWSNPIPIFLTNDPKLIPYYLKVFFSPSGQLHTVWNVVNSTGTSISVYYARLDLAQQQWSTPFLLETRIDKTEYFGPSFPEVVAVGNSVVVMYNSGNPSGGFVDAGRPVQRVRISNDGGQTWEIATTPFPQLQGLSGEHSLVVDSSQAVHALFIQRIDRTVNGKYAPIGGIWHSIFGDGQWSVPDRFVSSITPYDIKAAVSQGNVLLMTWREDPGAGKQGVWYSYMKLNSPEQPIVPVPDVKAELTVTPTTVISQSLPLQTATPGSNLTGFSTTKNAVLNPGNVIIISLIPVLLLIVIIFFLRYSRS